MKKTLKISIGGIAFIIEEEAYHILDNYLASLKEYYNGKPEGDEIITDVEARMSELLQMKINSSMGVVNVAEAKEIIGIMGSPKDFEDPDNDNNAEEATYKSKSDEELPFYRKKLYRDPSHSVIGGVCSGLGYYFRTDPVLIRLLFIALLFVFSLLSHKFVWFVILSYLVLWIVMPKAKTFRQKLSMVGKDPSIEGVINRDGNMNAYNPNTTRLGTTLVQILKIFVGMIMIIIGLALFISGVAVTFFYSDLHHIISLGDLLSVVSMNTFDVKFSLALLLLLPATILIYLGIRMFWKITSRDLLFAGIAFLIWLGTAVYIGMIGGSTISQYRNNAEAVETVDLNTKSDTLYVKLDKQYNDARSSWDETNLQLFKLDNDKTNSYLFLPRVTIEEDTTLTEIKMEITKKAFARSNYQAEQKANQASLSYTVNDSLVTITPKTFTNKTGFQGEWFKIKIKKPANKTVILDSFFTRNRQSWADEDWFYGVRF